MAERSRLKNKFISVNNNFGTTLSSRISPRSPSIPLVATPTKLGNFGYVTVNNDLGGQIIFYSGKTGNQLNTVLSGRGTDGTVRQARRGGTVVEQRVISANVSQNQRALVSLLQFGGAGYFSVGRRTTDPNGQQFEQAKGGYTGYDQIQCNSIVYKATSAQYSIGAQFKKQADKFYPVRFAYSGSVIGSNVGDRFSVRNTNARSQRLFDDQAGGQFLSTTRQYDRRQGVTIDTATTRNDGTARSKKILTPRVSVSALAQSSVKGGSFIGSRIGSLSSPTPLVIAAEDIVFLQRNINGHRLRAQTSITDPQNSSLGLTMLTTPRSLQDKIQLFNVRSASIYQPYTVVSTHWDSRIDSQVLRKDSDFFMSKYDQASTQSSSGGYLTPRYSVGSGISGDRWRLAYNENILTSGRAASSGYLNDAVQRLLAIDASLSAIDVGWDITTKSDTVTISNIYQSVVDRGWLNIFEDDGYAVYQQGYKSHSGSIAYNLYRSGSGVFQFSNGVVRNNRIRQFVSYSQSNDKLGLFNVSFHKIITDFWYGGAQPEDFGVMIVPVILDDKDYKLRFDQKFLTINSFNQTSVNSINGVYGKLYSITRDATNQFKNSISRSNASLRGLCFIFGFFSRGTTGSIVDITQIKLQSGLQRTRYKQNKCQQVNKNIFYDSMRKNLVIQNNNENGRVLFLAGKKFGDNDSQAVRLDFGKYVPLGHQGDTPFVTQDNILFWSQSSAFPSLSQGASIRWSSSAVIPSILTSDASTTGQSFGLVNRGRGVILTHKNNSNQLPDNGIYIYTKKSDNSYTEGNIGHISISACGSTASNIYLRSNKQIKRGNWTNSRSGSYSGTSYPTYFNSFYYNEINFRFQFSHPGQYSSSGRYLFHAMDIFTDSRIGINDFDMCGFHLQLINSHHINIMNDMRNSDLAYTYDMWMPTNSMSANVHQFYVSNDLGNLKSKIELEQIDNVHVIFDRSNVTRFGPITRGFLRVWFGICYSPRRAAFGDYKGVFRLKYTVGNPKPGHYLT